MPRRRPTPQLSADLRQTTHASPSEVGEGITFTFDDPIPLRQFFRATDFGSPTKAGRPTQKWGKRSQIKCRKCAPLQTRVIGAWFAQGEATMTKLVASLGLGALLLSAAPALACPAERPVFPEATTVRFAAWTIPVAAGDDEDGLSETTIAAVENDASLEAAYLAEEQATAQAMRLWMQSLASGLIALLTVALAAVGL